MDKKMIGLVLAAIVITMATNACDEGDDDCMDSEGCADGDTDGDGDGDTDGDSDSDGDTDSDTDTDTETETADPTACDCLNGVSQDEGCANIQGTWYAKTECCNPDYLMTAILTPLAENCKVEFEGDAFIFGPFEGEALPMSYYSEDSHSTLEIYLEDGNLVQKKTFESSEVGYGRYERCDC